MKYSIIKNRIWTNLGAQKAKKHALFFWWCPKIECPKIEYLGNLT